MKKRLFLYTSFMMAAGLLCFFAASVYITSQNNLRIARDTVMETARIYAGFFDGDGDIGAFVHTGGDTRVTVITPEGVVAADSRAPDPAAMENHLNRPEIQAAARDAPAAYIRRSETLGAPYIYYALKAADGDGFVYIRASVPVAKIDAYLYPSLPPLALLFFILAAACFFLARGMAGRVIRPLADVERKLRVLSDGGPALPNAGGGYEEINQITRGIDDVARVLQNSLDALRGEKDKLAYILNNIGDGLIVLDEDGAAALVNAAALDILNAAPGIRPADPRGLMRDDILAGAAEDCVRRGKNALFERTLNGRHCLVTVKRLPETALTMVVLADVSENRGSAKRREEFFANASHELKTPLTAIKGFNELTALRNQDEGLCKYINGIARETNRMTALIADMLKLSELENTRKTEPVPVSLARAVHEAGETMSAAMADKSIAFEISGDAAVMSEPGHIYDIVKNLIENAVRYNHPNGKVTVTVEKDAQGARMTVSDTGIGISPEEQTRIFERFYRVEKSRSSQSGGTGLGLSIVKHLCALYGWKLTLRSKPGAGTEVTIAFDAVAEGDPPLPDQR